MHIETKERLGYEPPIEGTASVIDLLVCLCKVRKAVQHGRIDEAQELLCDTDLFTD